MALTLFSVYEVDKPPNLGVLAVVQLLDSAVTIVGFLAWLFVIVAWRWSIFRAWLVRVPDIGGTWRGEITPLLQNHDMTTHAAPIPATLVVRQTLFSVKATMHTAHLNSRSYSGEAFYDEDSGEERLTYSYTTDPVLTTSDRNSRHDGTAQLVLGAGRPRTLKGTYWTDRLTRGEIELAFVGRRRNEDVIR